MRGRLTLLALAAVVASACTSTSPTGTRPAGDPLPVLAPWPLPTNYACGGVGMGPELTLEGSHADGVYALLNGSQRIPIRWPPGYTAMYDPQLSVRDPQGVVVGQAGTDLEQDTLTGGLLICVEGSQIEMLP